MNNTANHLTPQQSSHAAPPVTGATSVQYVRGVGPERVKLLRKLGINTIEDILLYFPWRYEDRKNLKEIRALTFNAHETTVGEVVSCDIITTPRKRMKIVELTIADNTGFLKAKWFNQPYLKKYFRKGHRVILSGVIKGNTFAGAGAEMDNPEFELIGREDTAVHTARIVPFYRATEGISAKQLRTLMYHTVESYAPLIQEYLPEELLGRLGLRPLRWAVKEAHFPDELDDIAALNEGTSDAHRRLAFDELFFLELGLALLKKGETIEKGIRFEGSGDLVRSFLKSLPFELTGAQKRVIQEIRSDMQSERPMNRLVHGDVGCGKTVVALVSMLYAVESGYQTCLMAPTELLAEQHYINIHAMAEKMGIRIALLTSSIRERPVDEVADGTVQIVVGTHALIQEQVKFRTLGLAVIDEQHRFGVMQRAALRRKGLNPDILIMTATPIPRTLAMTLYGDLDVSVINELPVGRKPVQTRVVFASQKETIYSLINRELAVGRQIYIVYPLIEESEKLDLKSAIEGYEAFQRKFRDRTIGLIHGRIPRQEREAIMSSFMAGEIDMLVATTVIEVGIDVPNASLMLIVHAERFGLAQLHQLRGRIGRGEYESHCLLLAYAPLSEEAKRRLKAMESTSDGFRIAEEDLAIRGPGDFFGTRQSGMPDMKVANIIRDIELLATARKESFRLVDSDPELKGWPLMKEALQKKWQGRLELVKS